MTTFLTQNDKDKKQFVDLISKVSTSIAKTFIDDKAYGGPTADELKNNTSNNDFARAWTWF